VPEKQTVLHSDFFGLSDPANLELIGQMLFHQEPDREHLLWLRKFRGMALGGHPKLAIEGHFKTGHR
jgi:hypothetical protein